MQQIILWKTFFVSIKKAFVSKFSSHRSLCWHYQVAGFQRFTRLYSGLGNSPGKISIVLQFKLQKFVHPPLELGTTPFRELGGYYKYSDLLCFRILRSMVAITTSAKLAKSSNVLFKCRVNITRQKMFQFTRQKIPRRRRKERHFYLQILLVYCRLLKGIQLKKFPILSVFTEKRL